MITTEELLEQITTEDVVSIMTEFGSQHPRNDNGGNLYFTTICHCGEKRKLQYFTDTKFFLCYTNCGSMSLFDLLMNVNGWTFPEALHWVAKYKGINLHKKGIGLQEKKYHNEDFDFLDKHLYVPKNNKIVTLPNFDNRVLNIFSDYYPDQWYKDGITEDVARQFGIRFCFNRYAAIIPHHDINGNLVGIRARNFLQQDIDSGRKYMPITIQGLIYRYPTHFNLYSLYQNQDNIRKFKRVILFEGEKSPMLYGSYYGQENNISVASLGMMLSLYQRDLLLNLGIEELVICYDKQYQVEYIDDKYKGTKEHLEYIKYIKTLLKITKLFTNYCNVSIVASWEDELDYKDAPIDKGKETFEKLYRDRYLVSVEELEEIIE